MTIIHTDLKENVTSECFTETPNFNSELEICLILYMNIEAQLFSPLDDNFDNQFESTIYNSVTKALYSFVPESKFIKHSVYEKIYL